MKINYNIDPAHSNAEFAVRHMMVTNVKGGFRKVTGTIAYDPQDPAGSTVQASIDAGSISTRDDQRDAHLRSADFLDVEKFPAITFQSAKVESVGPDELKVTGDLTIHGVTKSVVLNVEGPTEETKDPWGNLRTGLSATTKIKRSDFGLTWNAALEAGGVLVGDDLKIAIDVSAIRQG